jgi:uncharacterized membrane protein
MKTFTDTTARPHRLRLALTLSVVLNLFLLAMIAGHLLSHRVGSPGLAAGTPMAGAIARAEAELDPADAAAFRAALARERSRYVQAAAAVGTARHALARQIVAEPFDPHAVSEALDTWRASWDRFMGDFSGPLVDALSSISPQGRRRLIEMRRKQRKILRKRLEREQGAAGQKSP